MDVDKSNVRTYREHAPRVRGQLLRQFILSAVEKNPSSVAALAARTFGVSRQAVNRQLDHLVTGGALDVAGTTKGRTYTLRTFISEDLTLQVSPELHEDEVWTEHFAPHVKDLATNIQRICYYGFTEILNNVIDHSASPRVVLSLERNAVRLKVNIHDFGVGIFNKIQQACQLETPRIAVFELTKGKFTTDPTRHTGEGIFFTSRMFDSFSILSGQLFLSHERGGDDWLLERRPPLPETALPQGTAVFLGIDPQSSHTVEEVLTHYATEQDDYAFNRTTIAIHLAVSESEELVSRSQAKRISARLDKFKEVVLDFRGITSIGPAFADELFRVFHTQHPHVTLIPINANEHVTRMIRRASTESSEAS